MAHKHLLSHYFKQTDTSYIFTGEEAKVYIPQRYTVHDLLFVGKDIRTLGVFEIEITGEEEHYGYLLPAILTMCPSSTYNQNLEGKDYLVLVFKQNDIFVKNRVLLQQAFIASAMFDEFISAGNLPRFLKYDDTAMLFNAAQDVCGVNLRVPHSVFEMMYAHLSRDPDNLNRKYRFTDMKKPPVFIGLKSVSYGTDSTTTKIIGSYMGDGINSAIVNRSEQQYELEDLLRT